MDAREVSAVERDVFGVTVEALRETDARIALIREALESPDPCSLLLRATAGEPEKLYPCAIDGCEVMRTKAEGGTTFTICEACWPIHGPRAGEPDTEDRMWRQVPGWPEYEVSAAGGVRAAGDRNGSVLGQSISPWTHGTSGYQMVALYRNGGKVCNARVHRLVAQAFLGPLPAGHEVNHRNCVRSDNRVANLEYVTRSENLRHASEHGSLKAKKLGESKVREIRQRAATGESRQALAEAFGVTPHTIYCVIQRRTYKHVS